MRVITWGMKTIPKNINSPRKLTFMLIYSLMIFVKSMIKAICRLGRRFSRQAQLTNLCLDKVSLTKMIIHQMIANKKSRSKRNKIKRYKRVKMREDGQTMSISSSLKHLRYMVRIGRLSRSMSKQGMLLIAELMLRNFWLNWWKWLMQLILMMTIRSMTPSCISKFFRKRSTSQLRESEERRLT